MVKRKRTSDFAIPTEIDVNKSRSSVSPPLRRRLALQSADVDEAGKTQDELFMILSWNVSGASQFLQSNTSKITTFFTLQSPTSAKNFTSETNTLRHFLKRHNWPHIVCLQEVKIKFGDSSTKLALERAANRLTCSTATDTGPAYKAGFSLPRDKYNATGFGGKVNGVCTLIQKNLLSLCETKEVGWDLEGRVLVTELFKLKLVVINGYWINGTTYDYRCSTTGAVIGTRHDRKRAFHHLMLAEVLTYERAGWHVVLIGDMNVAPAPIDGHPHLRSGYDHERNRADFNSKFLSAEEDGYTMKGIDTFRYLHGGLKKYTYHGETASQWGSNCDRVDLGIVTRNLLEQLKGVLVGAEIFDTIEERGGSDHVPLSITLNLSKYQRVWKLNEEDLLVYGRYRHCSRSILSLKVHRLAWAYLVSLGN